jgi:hypothetical protein
MSRHIAPERVAAALGVSPHGFVSHDAVIVSGNKAMTITDAGVRVDPAVVTPSLETIRRQKGLCWFCGEPPAFTAGGWFMLCHEQQPEAAGR